MALDVTNKQQWIIWARAWLDGTDRSEKAAYDAIMYTYGIDTTQYTIRYTIRSAARAAEHAAWLDTWSTARSAALAAEDVAGLNINIDLIAQKVLS